MINFILFPFLIMGVVFVDILLMRILSGKTGKRLLSWANHESDER
jgi:hypothetical protein